MSDALRLPIDESRVAPIGPELARLPDNALFAWSLRRARRETATLAFGVLYLGAIYAIAAFLAFVAIRPVGPRQASELAAGFHITAWVANAIVLLLVVPLRFAQQIATERERKTIELLRLTSLSGSAVALGALASAYAFPLLLCLTSTPLVLASFASDKLDGFETIVSSYLALLATSFLYTLVAGAVAFLPKKAAQASGAATVALIAVSIAGGFFNSPYCEPLGCLAPWGAFVNTFTREGGYDPRFTLTILGAPLPGVVAQIPLCLVLGVVVFGVVASKVEREDATVFGVRGGALAALAITLASIITYTPSPNVRYAWWNQTQHPGRALGLRFVALFLVLLPIVFDAAVFREDLLRGLARLPGDPARRDERFRPWHGLAIAGLVCALLTAGLSVVAVALPFEVPTVRLEWEPLVVAGIAALSYAFVAGLVVQAARLWIPNKAPTVIATLVLMMLWLPVLAASWALKEAGAPEFIRELPLALCPFATLYSTADSAETGTPREVAPAAIALVAIFLNSLLSAGLFAAIHLAVNNAREFARTLIVLPADAFSAPQGALKKTCAGGHVFEAKWEVCPHCK